MIVWIKLNQIKQTGVSNQLKGKHLTKPIIFGIFFPCQIQGEGGGWERGIDGKMESSRPFVYQVMDASYRHFLF